MMYCKTAGERANQRCWAVLISIAWWGILIVHWPEANDGLTQDSAGYLEFSPYRQPLYGHFVDVTRTMFGSISSVKQAQMLLFGISVNWLLLILSTSGRAVPVASIVSLLAIGVLVRLGVFSFVASILTEGLFYTLVVLALASGLRSLEDGSVKHLFLFTFFLCCMTQLRGAAILVFLTVPVMLAGMGIFHYCGRSTRKLVLSLLSFTVFLMLAIPVIIGKELGQIGSEKSRVGYLLTSRVTLLEAPDWVREKSPRWVEMSASWRSAGEHLSGAALTQFDAQLQEAVKDELIANVLLPDLGETKALQAWQTASDYSFTRELALEWVYQDWKNYLRLSFLHMWGMVTMSNRVGSADRLAIWDALQSVSDTTWQNAKFRTDYPLNKFYEPLKPVTAVVNGLIRGAMMLFIAVVVLEIGKLVYAWSKGLCPAKSTIVVCLSGVWIFLHSVTAALILFPEQRYTYANALLMFPALAYWIAKLDLPEIRVSRFR